MNRGKERVGQRPDRLRWTGKARGKKIYGDRTQHSGERQPLPESIRLHGSSGLHHGSTS